MAVEALPYRAQQARNVSAETRRVGQPGQRRRENLTLVID
jgi:hypothetical protein